MSEHRERVFSALAQLVWSMDSPAALSAYLEQLGREHRKFGVREKHYAAFFDALLATVEHFNGASWTARTQAAFSAALGYTAAEMLRAAALDAQGQPPWWVGEVIGHELRSPSLAVLRIQPDQPLRYRAGQYLSVQVTRWPRAWRNFSIANAPRADGQLELHVRAVPGGLVSNSLVHHCQAGDTVVLGPARGDMTVPGDRGRDLVCIAGGSGLAPIKAIIEDVMATAGSSGARPGISLFVGAQRADDLYDLPALRAMESAYPQLTVIPVVSADPEIRRRPRDAAGRRQAARQLRGPGDLRMRPGCDGARDEAIAHPPQRGADSSITTRSAGRLTLRSRSGAPAHPPPRYHRTT